MREPNPAYATDRTKDNSTNYSYDVLGNLTQVGQPVYIGTAYTAQYRTFDYSNGAYLLSATNPENGTVVYTYNADGTVATKTDAKSQRAVYTYDAYGRVTMVKRGTMSGSDVHRGSDAADDAGVGYEYGEFDVFGERAGAAGDGAVWRDERQYYKQPAGGCLHRHVQLHGGGAGGGEGDGDCEAGSL